MQKKNIVRNNKQSINRIFSLGMMMIKAQRKIEGILL